MADFLELTARIVSAYAARNPIQPDQLPDLIRSVFTALSNAGQAPEQWKTKEPAVSVNRSVFNDHLVCLECGGSFKILKRHLKTDHNLTVEQYRERFNLQRDYPVVAPDYAKMRSSLAKEIGLGWKTAGKRGRKRT